MEYGVYFEAHFYEGDPVVHVELVWEHGQGLKLQCTETGGYISDIPYKLISCPERGKCEHGITEGEYCEQCKKEYEKAANDPTNK